MKASEAKAASDAAQASLRKERDRQAKIVLEELYRLIAGAALAGKYQIVYRWDMLQHDSDVRETVMKQLRADHYLVTVGGGIRGMAVAGGRGWDDHSVEWTISWK